MSSAFAVVFYGVRYAVALDEIEGLEARTDDRLQRARREGLETFWSRFGDDRSYFLFVGTRMSLMGQAHEVSSVCSREDVAVVIARVDTQLSRGDWDGVVGLHFQWGEDV
jgi:hypothetical protein